MALMRADAVKLENMTCILSTASDQSPAPHPALLMKSHLSDTQGERGRCAHVCGRCFVGLLPGSREGTETGPGTPRAGSGTCCALSDGCVGRSRTAGGKQDRGKEEICKQVAFDTENTIFTFQ